MYTLQQVVEGLSEGRAFERQLDVDGGMEYVTPSTPGYFLHSVAGLAHGGWGGSAELPIKQLLNGHFPKDGWREHTRR